MIKGTPKSCGCHQCKRGKHGGMRDLVKYDERRFRHQMKIMLSKGEEPMQAAPIGNYYD